LNRIGLLKELKSSSSLKKDYLDEKAGSIYINVLVKDKMFRIYCGDGRQKLRWLSDCAIYKFEQSSEEAERCGLACSIKLENGNICDLNDVIADILENNANVWILFRQEFEFYKEKLIDEVQ
jgi:hypothetical protein